MFYGIDIVLFSEYYLRQPSILHHHGQTIPVSFTCKAGCRGTFHLVNVTLCRGIVGTSPLVTKHTYKHAHTTRPARRMATTMATIELVAKLLPLDPSQSGRGKWPACHLLRQQTPSLRGPELVGFVVACRNFR